MDEHGTDWDWNSPECQRDVIIPKVDAVAIYLNPTGGVVIRQQSFLGDGDAFVVVPKSFVPTLIAALQKVSHTSS